MHEKVEQLFAKITQKQNKLPLPLLKVVSTTFLLVCFLSLNKSISQT